MDINDKYSGFEKLLRNKVSNFEYPYDNKEWLDFEKKLPKSQKKSITSPKNLFRFFILGIVTVGSAITIYYFSSISSTQNNSDKIASTKSNLNDATNDVKNNDNAIDNKTSASNNIATFNSNNNETNINTDRTNIEKTNNGNQNSDQTNIKKDNSSLPNKENSKKDLTTAENNKKPQNFGEAIIANISEGCAPLKVQFEPAKTTDKSVSLLWNFGDGKTSSKTNPLHIYSKAGSYDVSLTVTFNDTKISNKFVYSNKIIVKDKPAANYEYSLDDETEIYNFADNSTSALNWYWNFGDKSASTVKNPDHEYKQNGTYNVQLIVMNAYGCTDTTSKKVTVKLKDLYWCPSGFTPNGDGLNDYFGPKGDRMIEEGYKLTIFDQNGLLVFETNDLTVQWDGKIIGSNADAPQGIYYWKISMKDKNGILKDGTGYVTLMRQ